MPLYERLPRVQTLMGVAAGRQSAYFLGGHFGKVRRDKATLSAVSRQSLRFYLIFFAQMSHMSFKRAVSDNMKQHSSLDQYKPFVSLMNRVTHQVESYILLTSIWGFPLFCGPLLQLATAQPGQGNSPN